MPSQLPGGCIHVLRDASVRNLPDHHTAILGGRRDLVIVERVPGDVYNRRRVPRHLRVVDVEPSHLRRRTGGTANDRQTIPLAQPHLCQRSHHEGAAARLLQNDGHELLVDSTHVGVVRALRDANVVVAFIPLGRSAEDMAKLTRTYYFLRGHGECVNRVPSLTLDQQASLCELTQYIHLPRRPRCGTRLLPYLDMSVRFRLGSAHAPPFNVTCLYYLWYTVCTVPCTSTILQ